MNMEKQLAELWAKEEIRELVLKYSRGVDRKDARLLRTLYAQNSIDNHDESFRGAASDYIDFLEKSFPYMRYSGHHACNHMISLDVEKGTGEGEVYALAYHIIPDGAGGWAEDFMAVRYLDQYVHEDGAWKFAQRDVVYDMRTQRPHEPHREAGDLFHDVSFDLLKMPLFQKAGG